MFHRFRAVGDERMAAQKLAAEKLQPVGFLRPQRQQIAPREPEKRQGARVETILDGLFAEAVTVVESEGDRLVYGTTWERLASQYRHDVHFVSVGGIGGFANTCELYRKLQIPVCVIADLDLMRELNRMCGRRLNLSVTKFR